MGASARLHSTTDCEGVVATKTAARRTVAAVGTRRHQAWRSGSSASHPGAHACHDVAPQPGVWESPRGDAISLVEIGSPGAGPKRRKQAHDPSYRSHPLSPGARLRPRRDFGFGPRRHRAARLRRLGLRSRLSGLAAQFLARLAAWPPSSPGLAAPAPDLEGPTPDVSKPLLLPAASQRPQQRRQAAPHDLPRPALGAGPRLAAAAHERSDHGAAAARPLAGGERA